MPDRRARALRSNPTEAEEALWRHLRRKQLDGYRFRRQHPLREIEGVLDAIRLALRGE